MSIYELLEIGVERLKNKKIEKPVNIAKRLMCYVLNKDKIYLITNSEKEVMPSQENEFLNCISEIENHVPIQYVLHNQEFMKMNFYVNENVLIPRQDTEIVVEETIKIIKRNNFKNILDMCTGSGIIAISIAKYVRDCKVDVADLSKEAIEIAKMNAINNNVDVKFIQSDMFENIHKKYDLIISNPPYIKTDVIKTLSYEVQKEPTLALDGGKDGLDFYRILANNSYKFLNEDGYMVLEIGYDQKEDVTNILKANYKNIKCVKDYGNNNRIIICQIKRR